MKCIKAVFPQDNSVCACVNYKYRVCLGERCQKFSLPWTLLYLSLMNTDFLNQLCFLQAKIRSIIQCVCKLFFVTSKFLIFRKLRACSGDQVEVRYHLHLKTATDLHYIREWRLEVYYAIQFFFFFSTILGSPDCNNNNKNKCLLESCYMSFFPDRAKYFLHS